MYNFKKKEGVMPNKDGIGPEGKGPNTGRGLGNCDPGKTNEKNRSFGRGRGRGYGKGSGQGNRNRGA